jgi:hypothetical protein
VTSETADLLRVGDSVSEKAWTTGISGAILSTSDSVVTGEASTTLASLIGLVCTTGWVASLTSETADLLRVGDSLSEKAWTSEDSVSEKGCTTVRSEELAVVATEPGVANEVCTATGSLASNEREPTKKGEPSNELSSGLASDISLRAMAKELTVVRGRSPIGDRNLGDRNFCPRGLAGSKGFLRPRGGSEGVVSPSE